MSDDTPQADSTPSPEPGDGAPSEDVQDATTTTESQEPEGGPADAGNAAPPPPGQDTWGQPWVSPSAATAGGEARPLVGRRGLAAAVLGATAAVSLLVGGAIGASLASDDDDPSTPNRDGQIGEVTPGEDGMPPFGGGPPHGGPGEQRGPGGQGGRHGPPEG